MIMPENRITASSVVGGVGAATGGFWGFIWGQPLDGLVTMHFTLPLGIFSGALSCFFVSQWYLKFMEYKSWQWGILFGPLFGGLAGAISGAATGIGMGWAEMNVNPFASGTAVLWWMALGLAFGGLTGVVVGLISSLTIGPFVAKPTEKRNGYVDELMGWNRKDVMETRVERLSHRRWSLIGLIVLAIAVLAALVYLAIQLA